MKIAITGSSGFVGRRVCQKLAECGYELYLLDLCHPPSPIKGGVHSFVGNLATGQGLDAVPWGDFHTVLHLAAAGVKASRRNWMECIQVNLVGTQRLIECLRENNNRPRLIYTRSFYENHIGIKALAENPYIATKKGASDLIELYRLQTKAAVSSLKLYQVYGPGDDAGSVISYIINRLLMNKTAHLGSGTGKRDWIYIDDLVTAITASIEAPAGDYDIGTGQLSSLKSVAEMIVHLAGLSPEYLNFDPSRDRGDTEIQDAAERCLVNPEQFLPIQEHLKKFISHEKLGQRGAKEQS